MLNRKKWFINTDFLHKPIAIVTKSFEEVVCLRNLPKDDKLIKIITDIVDYHNDAIDSLKELNRH